MRGRRPSRILATLNEALLLQKAERFCTVVYARLQNVQGHWRVTVGSGGHPLPIRVTPDGHAAPFGRPGDLIGVHEQVEIHDSRTELRPRETLVFFSDGATEGRRGDEFYGEDRLLRWLQASAGASAAELVDAVVADVVDFQQGRPRDDLAVVAVQVPSTT